MNITRRWLAQLVVGFSLALPIRAEYRHVETTPAKQERPGPLSPLKRGMAPLNYDKFFIGLQRDLFDRGIAWAYEAGDFEIYKQRSGVSDS